MKNSLKQYGESAAPNTCGYKKKTLSEFQNYLVRYFRIVEEYSTLKRAGCLIGFKTTRRSRLVLDPAKHVFGVF